MQHFKPPVIRAAGPEDAPAVVALGQRFHREAGWGDIVDYIPADCEKTIRNMIEGEDGICVVAEQDGRIVGIAGGLAYPFYFNHTHKTGMELFWWVEPNSRPGVGRQLFDALEAEAKARGCISWTMIAVDKLAPDRVGMLYRRRGYRASEHSWIKRL